MQREPRACGRFVATVHDAARQGRFAMTLTRFAAASAPT
jgi:hypothetical protein